MKRVTFTLKNVTCIETEDYTGEDEFYVVGLYTVLPANSNVPREVGPPTISGIWDLNDGEHVNPNYNILKQSVVFDESAEVLRFDLKCLDRDISADLEDVSDASLQDAADKVKKAADHVADAEKAITEGNENSQVGAAVAEVISSLNPVTAALRSAEWITSTLWKALRGSLALDKDDLLGEDFYEFIPNVSTAPDEFDKTFDCMYDGCKYKVAYTVKIA